MQCDISSGIVEKIGFAFTKVKVHMRATGWAGHI